MIPSFVEKELSEQKARRRLPYPNVKIVHPKRNGRTTMPSFYELVLEGDEVEELGKEIEIYVIAERGQYMLYDPVANRVSHLSEILPISKIRQGVCLKTKKSVLALKEEFGKDLKFVNIVFCLVNVKGEWIPAVLYLKGALLQSWLVYKGKIEGDIIAKRLVLTLEDRKNGAVDYSVPVIKTFSEDAPLSDEDLSSIYSKFREEVEKYNIPDLELINTDTEDIETDTEVEF